MQMRSDSTEYVHIPITTDLDITGDTVTVGFVAAKNDEPATWYPTVHETGGVKILVGPEGGTAELAEGTYYLVVKITDNPEVPVLNAGKLKIT